MEVIAFYNLYLRNGIPSFCFIWFWFCYCCFCEFLLILLSFLYLNLKKLNCGNICKELDKTEHLSTNADLTVVKDSIWFPLCARVCVSRREGEREKERPTDRGREGNGGRGRERGMLCPFLIESPQILSLVWCEWISFGLVTSLNLVIDNIRKASTENFNLQIGIYQT